MSSLAARLAIERSLKLPDGCFLGLPQSAQRHQRDAIALVALGLEQVIAAIDRLADRRLGLRTRAIREQIRQIFGNKLQLWRR